MPWPEACNPSPGLIKKVTGSIRVAPAHRARSSPCMSRGQPQTVGLGPPPSLTAGPRQATKPAARRPLPVRTPRRTRTTDHGWICLDTMRNGPGSAFPQVKGRFHGQWRVMDSNQRRTTPTVLQGNVTTLVDQRLCLARVPLPRVFPAPNHTLSAIAVDGWTPNRSTRPSGSIGSGSDCRH
jgi:hypothetical protein